MADNFYCWHCNTQLKNVILPMSRREECAECQKDTHVCKMCEFYDDKRGCEEERAEHQRDLEAANFCDYFKPSLDRVKSSNQNKSARAKAELAALFGDEPPENNLEDASLTPAELAEKKLRVLLNN